MIHDFLASIASSGPETSPNDLITVVTDIPPIIMERKGLNVLYATPETLVRDGIPFAFCKP
jgi:hypothetical protein